MLTSSNQYLRPEYLTPLPTTLDAKKSPLALLAQTCSQIGADSSNSKLLLGSEKSSKSSKVEGVKEKSFSESSTKSPLKNLESNREKSKTPEGRSSSVVSTESRIKSPLATTKNGSSGRCDSNQSASSQRASPFVEQKSLNDVNNPVSRSSPAKSSERNSPPTSSYSTSKTAFTPNILTSSSDPAIKDLPLGTFKPGVPVSSAFLGAYPPAGFPLPIDSMSQHFALKAASALSPYFSYGRLKTQDSICRDIYCTGGCSSHLMGSAAKPPCPAGCAQCDHIKPPTSTGYLGHNPVAAAYAHAQLAALAAASHLPYVCNWISTDAAYCGKRFSSSEELLSHLRTHTSVAVSEASSGLSLLSASSSAHHLLHRTYPTPPLSPLATARYHPYSKPSLLPPSLTSSNLSGFPLTHSSFSPYLSPYSMYGPRLGAAPNMHP